MKRELIEKTKVYIIESPSFLDLLDNRKEGEALSKILDLSQIKNVAYSVSDKKTLKLALDRIADDVLLIRKDLSALHIHFSLHGNKEGIALSDTSFLTWKDFFPYIKALNDKIGYIENNGLRASPTVLVFSVCDGYHAKEIKSFDEENCSTYTVLIGPETPVEWADSLLAYSIFYHNIIYKVTGHKTALENMNNVIGTDVFKADPGTGLIML
jgi:hypothetical protein